MGTDIRGVRSAIAGVVLALALTAGVAAMPVAGQDAGSTNDEVINEVSASVTAETLWSGEASEVTFDYDVDRGTDVTVQVVGVTERTVTSRGTGAVSVSVGTWLNGTDYPMTVAIEAGDEACTATITGPNDVATLCADGTGPGQGNVSFASPPSVEVTADAVFYGPHELAFDYTAPQGERVEFSAENGRSATRVSRGTDRATLDVGNWLIGAGYPLDVSASTSGQTCTGTISEGAGTVTLDCGGDNQTETPARFEVGDVTATTPVTAGDAVDVTATVTNTGDRAGTQTVELSVGDSLVASQDLTLESDASETVTLTWQTSSGDAGDYSATVRTDNGSASADVRVDSPVTVDALDLSLGSTEIEAGNSTDATVTATFSNDTERDVTGAATLTSSNETVATVSDATVSGAAAGETTITASYADQEASSTLTVTGADDDDGGEDPGTGGDGELTSFRAFAADGYFQIGSGAAGGNEKDVIELPECPEGTPTETDEGTLDCVFGNGSVDFDAGTLDIPAEEINFPTLKFYSEQLGRNVDLQFSAPNGLSGTVDYSSGEMTLSGTMRIGVEPATFGADCSYTVDFNATTETSGSSSSNVGQFSGERLTYDDSTLKGSAKQVDAEFDVPTAGDCGALDSAINEEIDAPSPSGENVAVLSWFVDFNQNASTPLAEPRGGDTEPNGEADGPLTSFRAFASDGYFQLGSGVEGGNGKDVIPLPECPGGEHTQSDEGTLDCVIGNGTLDFDNGTFSIPAEEINFPAQKFYSEQLGRNVDLFFSAPNGLDGSIDYQSGAMTLGGTMDITVEPDTFGDTCGYTVAFEATTETSGSSSSNIGEFSGEPFTLDAENRTGSARQVDAEFSLPNASGCGVLNGAFDHEVDTPSPSGENVAVLEWDIDFAKNASSPIAEPRGGDLEPNGPATGPLTTFGTYASDGYFQLGSGKTDQGGLDKDVIELPECPGGTPTNESLEVTDCVRANGSVDVANGTIDIPADEVNFPEENPLQMYSVKLGQVVDLIVTAPDGLSGTIDFQTGKVELSGQIVITVSPEQFNPDCNFKVQFNGTSGESHNESGTIGSFTGEALQMDAPNEEGSMGLVDAEFHLPRSTDCGFFNDAISDEVEAPSPSGENVAVMDWYIDFSESP